MGNNLGIGLALEHKALRLEFSAQPGVVLDHAVVHHGRRLRTRAAAWVRMGIAIARRAVSGPPRVTDPAGAGPWLAIEQLFERPHPSGALAYPS